MAFSSVSNSPKHGPSGSFHDEGARGDGFS